MTACGMKHEGRNTELDPLDLLLGILLQLPQMDTAAWS